MNPAKATLVKASSGHMHTVVSLGQLKAVTTYPIVGNEHAAVRMRFEKATVETSVAELRRWERLCHDALSRPCEGVDISGALAHLDNGEVW